jgi:GAF domain-containing protein
MWIALVEAEDKMWDRQQLPTLPNACQRLAEVVRGLLNVDHCAVLLEKPDDQSSWQLVGWEPRRGSWPGVNVFPSRSSQLFALNRFDDVVSRSALFTGPDRLEEELFGGYGWKTSIRVPVKDRRGYSMALVVVATPTDRAFTTAEAASVALLAHRASARFESRRMQAIRFKLLDEIRNCASLRDMYPKLLDAALELTRATRGEVMYYDWDQKDLVLGPARYPPGGPVQTPGAAPRPSLSRKVWDTCEPIILYNMGETKPPDYHQNDPDTQSGLILPIIHSLPGERVHKLGILNLECSHPEQFDQRDQTLINELCQQAIAHAILTARTTGPTGIVEHLLNRPAEKRMITESILRVVRESFGFDCGIIYVPDYRAQKLIGYISLGVNQWTDDRRVFKYALTEKSLATWVFSNGKPLFISDVERDSFSFSRQRIKALNIKGSLLGLPLMIEEKREPMGLSQPIVAGVLIVWGNHSPSPIYEDIEALQPFARLAALVLRADQRDARDRTFLAEVQMVVQQFQTQRDLEANLQAVMRACLTCLFDRVRIWQFKYEDRMMPYMCDGMNFEHRAGFFNCVQTMRDNPYTQDLVNSVLRSDNAANLLARRYPFTSTDLIPDPDCEKLGKSKELPWIEVPLVFANKLYGSLAVDNLYSNRAFDADDFEYVLFFGSLAAQAFAIREMRGILNADNMATLYNRVGIEVDEGVVRRCLLRFLTHGEGGLGFPRALFLVGDNIRGKYIFADGVGSVSPLRI